MAKSESTTPKHFEYQVVTVYSIFADSNDQADEFLAQAMEHSVFGDAVNISKSLITKTEFLEQKGATKEYVWNNSEKKWAISKYNL